MTLTHGLLNKWRYLSCVISNISHHLSPLQSWWYVKVRLTPYTHHKAFTKWPWMCPLCSSCKTRWTRDRIPSKTIDSELHSSLLITSPLKNHILDQDKEYSYAIKPEQMQQKTATMQQEEQGEECQEGWQLIQSAARFTMESYGTCLGEKCLHLVHGPSSHRSRPHPA